MTKVYCADVSCQYCNSQGVCTRRKIALAWAGVHTVHDGYQEFNRCRMHQKSKRCEELEEFLRDHPMIMEEREKSNVQGS